MSDVGDLKNSLIYINFHGYGPCYILFFGGFSICQYFVANNCRKTIDEVEYTENYTKYNTILTQWTQNIDGHIEYE